LEIITEQHFDNSSEIKNTLAKGITPLNGESQINKNLRVSKDKDRSNNTSSSDMANSQNLPQLTKKQKK
jgi:hypothetical protein